MTSFLPNLLYLTIYNPSLHPAGPIPDGDDDAEEQAHILFYTSKDRAVSRDKMLRQVGLAKALVNFSEMFNTDDSCNSIHSQSRRMIMVSPEPNFWIHAAVEVAKTPRPSVEKNKGKTKEKPKDAAKGKHKDSLPAYDYYESSVHDLALRRDILRGYEQFKLTHGSFTSILSTLGQQALELQLERFFTVWAWSWNLEDGPEFGEQLGVPLHPQFRRLVAILDQFSSQLPDGWSSIIISPPHVVPSTTYTNAQHPTSLARHLLSLVPLRQDASSHNRQSSDPLPSDGTIKGRLSEPYNQSDKDPQKERPRPQSTFFGRPAVDMRKWNWPEYLTFGRGAGKKSHAPRLEDGRRSPVSNNLSEPKESKDTIEADKDFPSHNPPKDTKVISTDRFAEPENVVAVPSLPDYGSPLQHLEIVDAPDDRAESPPILEPSHPTHNHIPASADSVSLASQASSTETPSDHEMQPPEILSTLVYLAYLGDPVSTERRKLYYILHDEIMLAFIGKNVPYEALNAVPSELHFSSEKMVTLFNEIQSALASDPQCITDSLPSLTNILQPTDTHIVSASQLTVSASGFSSKSSHLYNAQELQTIDPEISEIFSRGQNPQHWHVARRGLGVGDGGTLADGEVYLQVFRKEASLADVDNVLAGVIRRRDLVNGIV